MSLSARLMDDIKTAMRAKDTIALEALRAIKSEILLAQTATGSKEEISEEDEIKLLQKLVKTRKDSAKIFTEQNRPKPNDLSFLKDQVVQLIHFKNASDEFFFTWYTYLSTIGIKTLVATDSEVETYVSRH